MEYIVHGSKNQIDSSIFTYFGAISVKRIRRFDLLTTDLGHALVVYDLTQTPLENKCGTVYHITCDNDPTNRYMEESKRPLGVRFKEHLNLDKPTGVGEHCLATGHSVSKNNIKVLCREKEWYRCKVKEAIFIKQHGPTMNRDQGYQLPPYTQILPPVSGSSHRQPMRDQNL